MSQLKKAKYSVTTVQSSGGKLTVDRNLFAINTGAGYANEQGVLATFGSQKRHEKCSKRLNQAKLQKSQRSHAKVSQRLLTLCPLVCRMRTRVEVKQLQSSQAVLSTTMGMRK